ncbi:hypothetical protein [Acetobacter nitrogenifigens]|uniref:hypothetical protein n=1 Tax=Acetobacter nitrogenifigens TaxID=285268 RepID=UPI002231E592|nr:hypothetical protein [Acetobacter nitrogenifigens]
MRRWPEGLQSGSGLPTPVGSHTDTNLSCPGTKVMSWRMDRRWSDGKRREQFRAA